MKEKIYPTLPTIREQPSAPVVNGGSDDRGHGYRLKIIREVQNFLEEEINKRDAFSKKYFRMANIVNMVDNHNYNRSRRNQRCFTFYWCWCPFCFSFRN